MRTKMSLVTSKVQQLRDQGFDLSYHVPFKSTWKVKCSQCDALVINGVPCHETGCPNEPKTKKEPEEDY